MKFTWNFILIISVVILLTYLTTAIKLQQVLSNSFSQHKDVPVMSIKYLQAKNVFDKVKCIIFGLGEIGFQLLSIIKYNNAINKNTLSFSRSPLKLLMVNTRPITKSRPLIFLFDSVHLFKCIRNNGYGQKDTSKFMLFPNFVIMEIMNYIVLIW